MATPDTIGPVLARGRDLWDSIYEPHAEKLYRKLETYHPDFMCESYPVVSAPARHDRVRALVLIASRI
jgi:hypothetical protein